MDYLYLGVPSNATEGYVNSWPGIIPNSQVVMIPYQLNEPSYWTMELYLSPSRFVIWITLAVIVSSIICGIIIFVLSKREKVYIHIAY